MTKPKLIVFDLDYTLWPFWVNTHVEPPFHLDKDKIFDAKGHHVKCFPDVPQMLHNLKRDGFLLGVASRTDCISEAETLIHLFGWKKIFDYTEIFPGSKTSHFRNFQQKSKIPFEEMLFFDDEARNIVDVKTLGVTCIHAKNGMSHHVLSEGFRAFQARQ